MDLLKISDKIKLEKGYCLINKYGLFFTDFNFNRYQFPNDVEEKLIKYSNNYLNTTKEKLAKITFFITSNCNLRCIYCYANSGETQNVLSFESAKIFIDKISEKVDKFIIDFHGGGEPFLEFDLIKNIFEYAKNTGKLYKSIAITNAYFAEEEKEKITTWIINNIDNLAISFDGTPEIQDKNRPTSSGEKSSFKVEEIVKIIANSKINLTVRATVTSQSSNKLEKIISYFHSLGVKNIIFSPYYNYGRTTDTTLLINPKEYAENFMKAFEYAVQNNINIRTTSFRVPGDNYCGAISAFNMCLTPDNYISSCYEVVKNSNNPIEEPFLIGKIVEKDLIFNKENLEKLKNINNKNECKTCNYKLLCRGGCPIKIARNSENSSKNLCQLTKILVPKVLNYIQKNPASAKNILNNIDLYY